MNQNKQNSYSIFLRIGIIFITLFLITVRSLAQSFEDRRYDYLYVSGSEYSDTESAIWAWLENNDPSRANDIYTTISDWARTGGVDPGWDSGWHLYRLQLVRVLYQYRDRVDATLCGTVEDLLNYFIRSKYGFHVGTLNNRLFDFVVRYLWSQKYPNVTVQYSTGPFDPSIPARQQEDEFTYDGREYILGNTYNSLALARDWLYWTFDRLTTAGDGNEEVDSEYTKTFIISLYTLYDFVYDSEMKRKAKMMLDFILLDSILDVSANLHGGHIGRTYGWSILGGQPQVYHWIYWGIGPNPNGSRWGQFYDAYVSTYRLPELIEDLGILDDEPDNYWHLNKENNRSGFLPPEHGKWTFVTKYYSLGGSTRQWMLNVKSNNSDYGIRMWINDIPRILNDQGQIIELINDYYAPMTLGTYGYQYKNVIFIKLKDPCLHIMNTGTFRVYEDGDNTGNLFDVDETISERRFLKVGNVAICVYMTLYRSAVEVAIIGVDYPTYDDFKTACINNAKFVKISSNPEIYVYITCKGDTISSSYDNVFQTDLTYVNSQLLWQFPFERLETEAYNGRKIVEWTGDREVTIRWHGKKLVYDLNSWTYTSEVNVDTEPPNPPQGVAVTPGESN